MTLIAHCIGLTEKEVESIKKVNNRASVRIISQNGLTVVKAKGIYDDLIEIVALITTFRTFEVNIH